MAAFTDRLGLRKPAGTDNVNVAQDINASMDKLSAAVGETWVNDGVRPSTAETFHGRIIRENGTGKRYTAKTNGSGGYDWIQENSGQWAYFNYGITSQASTQVFNLGAGGITRSGGTLSTSDIAIGTAGNSTKLIINVQGMYFFQVSCNLGATNTNRRFLEVAYDSDPFWGFRNEGVALSGVDTIGLTAMVKVETLPFNVNFRGYHEGGANNTFTSTVRVIRIG